ncbi:MAG: PaaI family thioesterase [Acidimicrobiales bacterium]
MSAPHVAPDQPPVTVDEVNAYIEVELPFTVELGIRCEALGVGTSLVRWRHDLRWTRPGGEHAFVSGPVMMTMADVGIYVAIFTVAGITPLALTNELRTNFLRPAFGGDLLCRSHIVKAGRRLAPAPP